MVVVDGCFLSFHGACPELQKEQKTDKPREQASVDVLHAFLLSFVYVLSDFGVVPLRMYPHLTQRQLQSVEFL